MILGQFWVPQQKKDIKLTVSKDGEWGEWSREQDI